jgi:hypothetical protein
MRLQRQNWQARSANGIAALALIAAMSAPYARPALCGTTQHETGAHGPTVLSQDAWAQATGDNSCHGLMSCGIVAVAPALDFPFSESALNEARAVVRTAPRAPARAGDPPVPPPPRI